MKKYQTLDRHAATQIRIVAAWWRYTMTTGQQNNENVTTRTKYAWENRCSVILKHFAGFNKIKLIKTETQAPFNNE
jgi:hypothetical protein